MHKFHLHLSENKIILYSAKLTNRIAVVSQLKTVKENSTILTEPEYLLMVVEQDFIVAETIS